MIRESALEGDVRDRTTRIAEQTGGTCNTHFPEVLADRNSLSLTEGAGEMDRMHVRDRRQRGERWTGDALVQTAANEVDPTRCGALAPLRWQLREQVQRGCLQAQGCGAAGEEPCEPERSRTHGGAEFVPRVHGYAEVAEPC